MPPKKIKMMFSLLVLAVGLHAAEFKAGDKIEINYSGKWYPGEVVEAKDGKFKVHYAGYSAAWDEWAAAERVRAPAPVAVSEAAKAAAAAFKPGDRVEGKTFGMWFKGAVAAVADGKVKVKFDDGTEETLAPELVRPDAESVPAAAPATAARPAGAKTGIEGAYLRVESFFMGNSLTLSNQAWFFTKDGKFSRAPAGGFSFKDFAPTRKTDGTYWVSGGKLTLAYADGAKPLVYDFENKGDELKWGGLGATRVEGFKKGWRIAAVYEGGASIGGGAMMSSSTLVFMRDGTYAHEGVANFSNTNPQSTVSGGAQSEAAGTYEFDGFTLTLTPKGEVAQRYTVLAFGAKDAAGRPEYIYRDGTMMKRQ